MRHAMDPKVCERYREERGRTGLTPHAFARAGGLCNANIYNIENGKHCPSWKSLAVLAQLGGDVHYVLTGERKSQTRVQRFLNRVHMEVNAARRKFPKPHGLMRALTEEVGELAKAIAEEPWTNVTKEAHQVAATAARVALEGDPTLQFERARNGAEEGDRMPGSAGGRPQL